MMISFVVVAQDDVTVDNFFDCTSFRRAPVLLAPPVYFSVPLLIVEKQITVDAEHVSPLLGRHKVNTRLHIERKIVISRTKPLYIYIYDSIVAI